MMEAYDAWQMDICLADYALGLAGDADATGNLEQNRNILAQQVQLHSNDAQIILRIIDTVYFAMENNDSAASREDLLNEYNALGLQDAPVVVGMSDVLFELRTGKTVAEGMRHYAKLLEQVSALPAYLRGAKLYYYRMLLAILLSNSSLLQFKTQIKEILSVVKSYTQEEIEQLGQETPRIFEQRR